jgi:MSHA biogenesis protein MshJ
MKAWWTKLAARVDALSLRERVFLFATLIVLSMLLANVLWVAPAQLLHQQITQRIATQSGELQRLRDELSSSGSANGPGQQVREELAQVRERLAAVNQEISRLPMAKSDEVALTKVLVHFLRRHEGLVLVRTATLDSSGPNTVGGNELQALASVFTVKRQGLELTVAGPYHELTRYVQTLERALPALRWGTMRVNSEKQTTELTLQVWLLRGEP